MKVSLDLSKSCSVIYDGTTFFIFYKTGSITKKVLKEFCNKNELKKESINLTEWNDTNNITLVNLLANKLNELGATELITETPIIGFNHKYSIELIIIWGQLNYATQHIKWIHKKPTEFKKGIGKSKQAVIDYYNKTTGNNWIVKCPYDDMADAWLFFHHK